MMDRLNYPEMPKSNLTNGALYLYHAAPIVDGETPREYRRHPFAEVVGARNSDAVTGPRGWIDSGGAPAQVAARAEGLQAVSEGDRVRAIVASEAAFDDPVLALKQVERISNPLKRSELFQEVFPNLVEENPQLARRALGTIKLSPVAIEYFQSMLGP